MNLPKVILLQNKILTTAEKNVHLLQHTELILVNNDDDKNTEPETLNQQIWRCQEVASKRLFYEKDFEKLFPLSHEDGLADDDADVMLVHRSFPNFNVDKAADLRGSLQFGLRS